MLKQLDPLLDESSGISLFITRFKGTSDMRVILTVRPNKTSLKEKDNRIASYSPKILTGHADELELELTSEKIMSILRERVEVIREVDAEVEKKKEEKAVTKAATAAAKPATKAAATKAAKTAPPKQPETSKLSDEEKALQNRLSNVRNLVIGGKRNDANAEMLGIATAIREGRAAGRTFSEEFIIAPYTKLVQDIRAMPDEQSTLDL